MATAAVNNGVNVQALLDAREALKGAPREATKFTWRATCKWQSGTHSKSNVLGFFGLLSLRQRRIDEIAEQQTNGQGQEGRHV